MPGLYNNSSASNSVICYTTIVWLSTLTEESAEPNMTQAINADILRIIVNNYHNQRGSNDQAYSKSQCGLMKPSSMPHTRLLLCCVFQFAAIFD